MSNSINKMRRKNQCCTWTLNCCYFAKNRYQQCISDYIVKSNEPNTNSKMHKYNRSTIKKLWSWTEQREMHPLNDLTSPAFQRDFSIKKNTSLINRKKTWNKLFISYGSVKLVIA